jgi:hypothetical protein
VVEGCVVHSCQSRRAMIAEFSLYLVARRCIIVVLVAEHRS